MSSVTALLISFGAPLVVVAIVMLIYFGVRAAKLKFLRTLTLRPISIRLIQKTEGKEPLSEIKLTEQLLGLLGSLKMPFALEVAVHNIGEDIHFYAAVPQESLEFSIRQIQSLWPDSQIQKSDDYTIFNSEGVVKAAYLKQKQHFALPIKTYAEAGVDTFPPILNNFSKLEMAGEGLAVQIIAQPATASKPKTISKMIDDLKRGAKLSDLLAGKSFSSPSAKKGEVLPAVIVDDEAVKALNNKIAKPLLNVNIRLVASAVSAYRSEELLNALTGSLGQFAAVNRNEFKSVEPRNAKNLIFNFVFRTFNESEAMILNTEELASVWHLPTSGTDIPKLKWMKSREATPPTILPESGVLIGESVFRGESKPVYVTDEDRRRHIYLIGQTGTGKSTLLVNMVASDIKEGKGLAIIDPHGELIESIVGLVPEERAKDVIIFDPSDLDSPLGLNMLEYNPARPEEKTFIVNEMQSIFNKLFTAETMGPMFEQYMRNALLLLMDDPNEHATLIEVPRVFTDSEFRKRLLAKATNPTVKDFWEKEAVKAGGEASLANMTPYITSKFNNFISNDYIRPIIGQPVSSLNFRNLMDEGKILLINLSKGKIGDINANLIGMILVGKILMAALSRVDIPQEKRRDFNLFIDEFQNFIGSQIVFRVGADDAEFLGKQFEPVFSKNDLMNIDNFNAYAKLLINGQTTKPFNIRTIPSPKGNPAVAAQIQKLSRTTYGRNRQEVETSILQRLRQ